MPTSTEENTISPNDRLLDRFLRDMRSRFIVQGRAEGTFALGYPSANQTIEQVRSLEHSLTTSPGLESMNTATTAGALTWARNYHARVSLAAYDRAMRATRGSGLTEDEQRQILESGDQGLEHSPC